MIVLHGSARFGEIDGVDGEYVVTRFLHVCMLPVVPIASEQVTMHRAPLVGHTLRWSWRSAGHAYLRTWGLVATTALVAMALTGATAALLPAVALGMLVAWSFRRRRRCAPAALRRALLLRPVLGSALDPAQLPVEAAAAILPLAHERFRAVSGGRSPLEVARDGATSHGQAASAFVLLRVLAGSSGGARRREALAASRQIADGAIRAPDAAGPYRVAAPPAGSPPPIGVATERLAPDRHHFIVATLAAYFVLGLLTASPTLTCFCEGKGDIARAGVRKLAFEAYPQWVSRPANAARCPTVEQLAEYGGSIKDPWGEPYRTSCAEVPNGAVGIAVWSAGDDRRDGTTDDITSWERQ